ncbi:MAG: Hpt domain-containing protein [Gammaproteobacteria bacterium]
MATRIVRVDLELKDLIPGFLNNRQQDALSIRAALAQEDMETVRILGHSMKGCAGGYGFNALSVLGGILEQGAQNRDSEAITTAVDELQTYLAEVEIIYD